MSILLNTRRSLIVSLLVLIGLFSYEISFLVSEAQAIPAFARKYGLPCNVCHVPGFPKLNDFGNQFRDQGINSTRRWTFPLTKPSPWATGPSQ